MIRFRVDTLFSGFCWTNEPKTTGPGGKWQGSVFFKKFKMELEQCIFEISK